MMCCVQMYKTLLKIRLRHEFVYLIGYNTAAHFIYTHCVYFLLINFQNHVPTGIFHRGRFARAGGATNFSHVKNQSRGHAQKVECSSTFMACPRAFRRTKNAQVRQLQRKLSNVRSARSGKATAVEHYYYYYHLY